MLIGKTISIKLCCLTSRVRAGALRIDGDLCTAYVVAGEDLVILLPSLIACSSFGNDFVVFSSCFSRVHGIFFGLLSKWGRVEE